MSTKDVGCPKCKGQMETGFIMDANYGESYASPSRWLEGKPEKSIWSGVKMSKKKNVQIETLRCVKCGYLESYAR